MQKPAQNDRGNYLLASTLIALPALAVFLILAFKSPNLPLWDDYDAGLAFLAQMLHTPTPLGKLLLVLTAQHNDYKLFFVNTLIWFQYALLGPLDFRLTSLLGNLLLLPVALCLWKLFLPSSPNRLTRLVLFFPVACIWFQLNAVETLNWGISAYQTLPILAFVLGGICLLLKDTPPAYAGALLCLVGGIFSNGNGFLFALVGALLLLQRRRFAALTAWLSVTVLCVTGYAYHYRILHRPPATHKALLWALTRRPIFVITFLGNAASARALCPLLGIAICLFWLWMAKRGYLRRNPAVAYALLFIFLTAVMVMIGRVDATAWASIDSRYRIYSNLLLIFAWQAIIEEFIPYQDPAQPTTLLRNATFRYAALAAVLFALSTDIYGFRYLSQRNLTSAAGMADFEHPTPQNTSPNPVRPFPEQGPGMDSWDIHARQILIESIRLGTYRPPQL